MVFESKQASYSDNPQKLNDEIVYNVGVTASVIDTMCTEHRAELLDFLANLKQKFTAAETSSRNR
ncbi:hypothetical protein GS682_31320 [Nostoc sp. B(2019)]|nr:hypothetical protein [Nostoc sp. B(2019)]